MHPHIKFMIPTSNNIGDTPDTIILEIRSDVKQGSKIALVHSYLQVPQAAEQVKILIFLLKIKFFPIYANNFCDAGQVPIFRYFEACQGHSDPKVVLDTVIPRCIDTSNLGFLPQIM